MFLQPGQKLSHYRIIEKIGAGGMGVVYKALDLRLDRQVAIKFLPEGVARDPEKLARLEREARSLAAINHPNIAAIHEFEESDDVPFLVLELVPGGTLQERLATGPLGTDDALAIARQVADALSAAHERGIVHRDLKPENIKITPDGKVKVLDFGLAVSQPAPTPADVTSAPTLTSSVTREGAILGTPGYMSPEQARGMPTDRRTDLWSFGCVLYETLCGRQAFPGATPADSLAAILTRSPDWEALPKGLPPEITALLRRCLEKESGLRWNDASEARRTIEGALAARGAPGTAGIRSRGLRTGAAILGAALAALLLVIALDRYRGGVATERLQPKLSMVTFAEGVEDFPAWSPDGAQIAYSAERGRVRGIRLMNLRTNEESQVTAGDFDDIQPAWSPDGRTLLFVRAHEPGKKLEPGDVFGVYDDGDVWAWDVASRTGTKLVDNAFNAVFSPDGRRIAVDASWAGPRRIWTVDAHGHNPQQLTSDTSEAVVHVRPRWSADGSKVVFQNIGRTNFDIRFVDVRTKESTWVTNDAARDIDPVWSPSGRFIYFSSDRGGGINIWRIPMSSAARPAGNPQQVTTGAGQDVAAALSIDGKSMAFSILRQNADLWKLPVSPETGRPSGPPVEVIATTREDSRGAWSPDGRTIAFNSDRAGPMNIWLASLGNGTVHPLTQGPGGDYQPNWSPEGARIAFFSSRSGALEIWTAEVATGALHQLTRGGSIDVNPFFSTDGKRIAYQSDGSGRLEVWIMNADGTGQRQLTEVGVTGHFMRWSKDGRSIFFKCPCGTSPQTMRIADDGGEPRPTAAISGGSHMSFSPDGTRVMDVVQHKTLWVSPLEAGTPEAVFQFEDPDVRIDYPVWSPDGRWVLFDHFRPEGGDIWRMDNFE